MFAEVHPFVLVGICGGYVALATIVNRLLFTNEERERIRRYKDMQIKDEAKKLKPLKPRCEPLKSDLHRLNRR